MLKVIVALARAARITPLLVNNVNDSESLKFLLLILITATDVLFVGTCVYVSQHARRSAHLHLNKLQNIARVLSLYMEVHKWIYFNFKSDYVLGSVICSVSEEAQASQRCSLDAPVMQQSILRTIIVPILGSIAFCASLCTVFLTVFLYTTIKFSQKNLVKPRFYTL